VTRLLAKARAPGIDLPGEREEMGLVGVLTLQLLSDAYGRQFADRARAAKNQLAKLPCHVFVDRLNNGVAAFDFASPPTSNTRFSQDG
jgi:asparagine synthase (glutamine-hydrolysing)